MIAVKFINDMHFPYREVLLPPRTTLFCLISVGYHLEVHIAITFYQEYRFLP